MRSPLASEEVWSVLGAWRAKSVMSYSMLNLFKMCSPGNCLHAAKVPPTLTCKEGSLEVAGRWLTLWYCLVEKALKNTEDFSPHDFLQHWMCCHHCLVTTHPRSEKQGTLGTMSEWRKKQAKSKQVWSHDRLGHVTRHWHISANLYKSVGYSCSAWCWAEIPQRHFHMALTQHLHCKGIYTQICKSNGVTDNDDNNIIVIQLHRRAQGHCVLHTHHLHAHRQQCSMTKHVNSLICIIPLRTLMVWYINLSVSNYFPITELIKRDQN